MTTCRVCQAGGLYIVRRLEHSVWALCRRCLYLQRTPLQASYTDQYVFNTAYAWGVTNADFSDEEFRRNTAFVGRWWDFFARTVSLRGRRRVLDVGSGTGPLLEHVRDNPDVEAIGVEPSVRNSEFSRGKGHTVVTGFLTDGMFADASFDVVHLSNCVPMIADPLETFRLLHRLLKRDGYIFCADKEYRGSALYPGRSVRREDLASYPSRPFMYNLMMLTGFEVIFYRNVFGDFKLVARRGEAGPVRLRGRFPLEALIVTALPITDPLLDALQRMVLAIRSRALPSFVQAGVKALFRKWKLLP